MLPAVIFYGIVPCVAPCTVLLLIEQMIQPCYGITVLIILCLFITTSLFSKNCAMQLLIPGEDNLSYGLATGFL